MKPATATQPAKTAAIPQMVVGKALSAEKNRSSACGEKLRIVVREAKKSPEHAKTHKPGGGWEWVKGSSAKKARAVLGQLRGGALMGRGVSLAHDDNACRKNCDHHMLLKRSPEFSASSRTIQAQTLEIPGPHKDAGSIFEGRKSVYKQLYLNSLMVPRRGLEPPRLSPLVPETSASTNSATWATWVS